MMKLSNVCITSTITTVLAISLLIGGCSFLQQEETTVEVDTVEDGSHQEQYLQSDATEHLQVETPPAARPARASDDRITIQLDSIERGKRLPNYVAERFDPVPSSRPGQDLVAVSFSVVETDTAYITGMFGFGWDNPSVLLALSGERYDLKTASAEPPARRLAADDLSRFYLSEGSTLLFIFEVPDDEELVALRYTYGYKTSEEDVLSRDVAEQRGQVELPLTDS